MKCEAIFGILAEKQIVEIMLQKYLGSGFTWRQNENEERKAEKIEKQWIKEMRKKIEENHGSYNNDGTWRRKICNNEKFLYYFE